MPNTKKSSAAVPLHVVEQKRFESWKREQPTRVQLWLDSIKFSREKKQHALIPNESSGLGAAVALVGALDDLWEYARIAESLPPHSYAIASELSAKEANAAALGWALGNYRFDRYKPRPSTGARLVWPAASDRRYVSALRDGICLCRDLITTPANDMGPVELSRAAKKLARSHGAKFHSFVGQQLVKNNYPAIFAVGRASEQEPRLIDLRWGKAKHPRVTLVGKGVCFDTGGLDLKPAQYMELMKKDMAGAALVLGLAHAIMSMGLSVRLRVLVPAVENSVSDRAMRPLDVIQTRKGLSVEVGNTDAEGRLVLADALAEADSEHPDLIIDAATLTGAARVALGTSLPALFASDDELASWLLAAGLRERDPLWQLPLHQAYRAKIKSRIADLTNNAPGPYAGAITAALFLREFVSPSTSWLHIDTMGYNLESLPGRPKGGEAFALRALFSALCERYPKRAPKTATQEARPAKPKKKAAKQRTAKKARPRTKKR